MHTHLITYTFTLHFYSIYTLEQVNLLFLFVDDKGGESYKNICAWCKGESWSKGEL